MKSKTTKLIFAMLMFPFLCLIGFGQSFTVSPSNDISAQIYENGSADLQIDLTNTSGGQIVFEWENVSSTFDTSWTTVLCDYQACFPYIPSSGTMTAVDDGGYGFIKLTVIVGENPGSGMATFNVWPSGNPSAAQTLTFTVDALTGVEDEIFASSVKIYPNPVSDLLYFQNIALSNENGILRVMDFSGAVVLEQEIFGNDVKAVDISMLPMGMYLVRFESGEKSTSKRILKVN